MGGQLVNAPTISAEMFGVRYKPGIISTLSVGIPGVSDGEIRAEILDDLELDPEDGAVAFGRDLVEIHVAAAVNRAREILAARFDPLHRLLQLHGNPRQQDFLGIGLDLGAEASADFGSHHAEPVFFQPQNLRDQRAYQVRGLGGGEQSHVPIGSPPVRDHAAGFHGIRNQPLADDALLDDDVGLCEGLVDVAAFLVEREGDIIRPLRMHRVRPGRERLFGIGNGVFDIVIDFDQIDAVARDVAIGRDDYGYGVTDEIHAVDRQHVMMRDPQPRQ